MAGSNRFLSLFDRVATHVKGLGVKVAYVRHRRLSEGRMDSLVGKSKIPIPSSLIEFYQEVGNGLTFGWSSSTKRGPFASITFPRLEDVIVPSLEDLQFRIEWSDTYDYRFTDDPKLAKQTARRMRHWLPLLEEDNGDRICFDTGDSGAPIVFDQHDWMDGGTGANGHVLARSLFGFFEGWSHVCFQGPKSLYWPSVFEKEDGINWHSDEFREPFRFDR